MLKVPELDLEKCLQMCRAAELSKVQTKTLEASDTLHAVAKGRVGNSKQNTVSQTIRCKFCGLSHERDKQKCPALGKQCVSCHKFNHFASQCKTAKKSVHVVLADDGYDEIQVVSTMKSCTDQGQYPKKVYATINVGKVPVQFQLDSGATCNVISKETLQQCLGEIKLEKSS